MSSPGVPGPGSLLENRYRLDAVIARGGMSTVHLATDERLDRHVAVKLLDPALAGDPVFVDRFTLEARSVARLSDPGIVQVFDQGVESGVAFLVMELVPGGTLRELLDERGPMPPYAAAAVLRPLLGALTQAHEAGLVHRDIKPENVLISTAGTVKLADFGLVRAAAESRATSRSVVMGTAAYLSPEQIAGEDTDARSDLYSLGVLAYEMLTGDTPFHGDSSLAVAYRRLEADVPPPSQFGPAVADDLDALVLGATSRDREERFPDARSMRAALDRAAGAGRFPPYRVPAPQRSAWSEARAAAARRTGPGTETEFDAAIRESGESPRHPATTPAGPVAGSTRVHTRADLTGVQADPWPGPVEHPGAAAGPPAARDGRADPVLPRRRTGWAWLAVVLLLAILLAVAGWWLGSGRFATVPSVQGMSVGQAVAAVNEVGLVAQTRDTYSDRVPRSGLVGTDPAPGTRVPRGQRVAVLVSQGRPVVPDIGARRDVDTVSRLITERSLRPVRGPTAHSDSVPVGEVVSLTPRSGTTVSSGSTVTMVVSSGPAPVAVPDVAGLDRAQARRALESAGLGVDAEEKVFDASVDGGRAVGTDPGAGRELPRGSTVTLRVSSAIEVPDVVDMPVDRAQRTLQDAGLQVVVADPITDDVVADGRVARTVPAAGTRVDPADPVVRLVPSDAVTVPMVLGRRGGEAIRTLEEAGLRATVDTGTRNGVVYGQIPLPGRVVARGETVELDLIG